MSLDFPLLRLRLPRALGCLFLVAAAAAPDASGQRPQNAEIKDNADWVARDARVGFDRQTAGRARQDLQSLEPGDYGRSSALVALGASGSLKGREVLMEETLPDRLPAERAAAAYGLGELGSSRIGDGMELLIRLTRDPEESVAEAAMVALARIGETSARQAVAERAAGGGPLAASAQQILAHRVDPSRAAVPAAFQRFYRLHWDAARNYGVIDGKIWSSTLIDELSRNDLFLEALTLRLVQEVNLEGAKDHLLEILLEGEGLKRIDTAVEFMPAEVEMLIESGVWRPQDRKEWRWLVTTILHEELDPFFPRSLTQALEFDFPSIRAVAAGLLYRRDSRFEDILIEAFDSKDASARADAAYAAGAGEITDFLGRLRKQMSDEDSWAAANAIGALIRMGSPQGVQAAVDLLAREPEDRPQYLATFLFEVLARAAPDEDVLAFIDELAPRLSGVDRASADSVLLINGYSIDTAELRAELPLLNPLTPQAFRGAQALGKKPSSRDVRLLARLFPREQAPDMNLELAAALARNGHRAPEPLLRAAVWRLPWNQSVLAAGVVAESYGIRTLIQWVTAPPPGATDEDVRRVGYAIGEFGGMDAVRRLQRELGTTNGAELPALQLAVLGALGTRTR